MTLSANYLIAKPNWVSLCANQRTMKTQVGFLSAHPRSGKLEQSGSTADRNGEMGVLMK